MPQPLPNSILVNVVRIDNGRNKYGEHLGFHWQQGTSYHYGCNKPNYPVPAIPLQVKYNYTGCVNIDDVTNPDDPVIVWMYDSWNRVNC